MSEPGIKDLTDFALFLPFSHIETRQIVASISKAEYLELIEKTRWTRVLRGRATTCKTLQSWSS
jgi:hypothetical protein